MVRRSNTQPNPKKQEPHVCGECANVTEVYDHHTLTVRDRKPTLGTCPFWKGSRCVLLSQKSCINFKPKP